MTIGRLLGAIVALASTTRASLAGDIFTPESPPDPARCAVLGDGFSTIKGSNACIRISGYVAAGADFAGSGRLFDAFAPKSGGGFDAETAVSADMRVETPLGPGRLYVQFGHDASRP